MRRTTFSPPASSCAAMCVGLTRLPSTGPGAPVSRGNAAPAWPAHVPSVTRAVRACPSHRRLWSMRQYQWRRIGNWRTPSPSLSAFSTTSGLRRSTTIGGWTTTLRAAHSQWKKRCIGYLPVHPILFPALRPGLSRASGLEFRCASASSVRRTGRLRVVLGYPVHVGPCIVSTAR